MLSEHISVYRWIWCKTEAQLFPHSVGFLLHFKQNWHYNYIINYLVRIKKNDVYLCKYLLFRDLKCDQMKKIKWPVYAALLVFPPSYIMYFDSSKPVLTPIFLPLKLHFFWQMRLYEPCYPTCDRNIVTQNAKPSLWPWTKVSIKHKHLWKQWEKFLLEKAFNHDAFCLNLIRPKWIGSYC